MKTLLLSANQVAINPGRMDVWGSIIVCVCLVLPADAADMEPCPSCEDWTWQTPSMAEVAQMGAALVQCLQLQSLKLLQEGIFQWDFWGEAQQVLRVVWGSSSVQGRGMGPAPQGSSAPTPPAPLESMSAGT